MTLNSKMGAEKIKTKTQRNRNMKSKTQRDENLVLPKE